MEPQSARSETARQLAELRAQLAADTPEIYRNWALYLQVLRQELPSVVEQTFFHLAVEVYPDRYRAMTVSARHALHTRLARLVQRASSLLTVEQLHALAAQTHRRLRRRAQRQSQEWMSALQQPAPGLFETDERASPEAPVEPPGSVSLGMALPINTAVFGRSAAEAASSDSELDVDQAEALLAQGLESALGDAIDEAFEPQGAGDSLMPTTPHQLLRWFDTCDAALAQRLRNLSHAINVELVRLGLSTSLLPLPLLEAVASGQIETLNAPLHLARVNLPLPQLELALPTTLLCVLLRPADLEADRLRLRTCRSRLQQSRQQVRRMAQTDQRLERRLQALEAEQLWLHDHSTAHPSNRPPTA